jgi:hypothetical protein
MLRAGALEEAQPAQPSTSYAHHHWKNLTHALHKGDTFDKQYRAITYGSNKPHPNKHDKPVQPAI